MTIHATALAINGRAVLIRGASGAGKSDLALRLLTLPRDALQAFGVAALDVQLITDDRVVLEANGRRVLVSCPPALRGKLEVRGMGIINVAALADRMPLAMLVDLVSPKDVERMPEMEHETVLGIAVPAMKIAPFEASAPLKIALALSAQRLSE